MATLQFTPTAAFTGDATLTTVATDGSALTDTDTTIIRVVGTPTAPTLTDLEGKIPESTGFLRTAFDPADVVLFGDGVSNNPNTATVDASTLEATIEAAVAGGVTPSSVIRSADGIGSGLTSQAPTTPNNINFEQIIGENTALTYTGLIHLTANVEYAFSGYADDVLHIELGGKTLVSTNTAAANAGLLSNMPSGEVTQTTFTPSTDGYYTIEIYLGNIDSNAALLLNLEENSTGTPGTPGIPKELNAENYSIFAGADDLIRAGGQIGNFVSNGADGSPDGGYFPVASGVDIVGVEGEQISLALLPLEVAVSDVVTSVTINDLPANIIIREGNTIIFNNNAGEANAGQSSFTFIPKSDLNSSGATVHDLSNITISGLTEASAPYNFTIDAQALPLTGTGAAASLTGATFTVGVLPTTYAGTVDSAIASTSNDSSIVFGSGVNETLTADSTGQILYAAAGNDILVGNGGSDSLFGGAGSDIIRGNNGGDLIIGGQGVDTLTGGEGEDTFAWISGDDSGAPTDTITDFVQGSGGDVIDLSGLLTGENPLNYNSYLTLSGTTLTIDSNGDGSGTDLTINLTGLTATTVDQLVSDGNIKFNDERIKYQGTAFGDGSSSNTGPLQGTSADDIFFSGGIPNSSDSENVNGNGGRDTYVVDSATYGSNSYVRIRDFTFTPGSAELDAIDLSDVLVGATSANIGDYIDIRFNNFGSQDVIEVYFNGDAPGNGTEGGAANIRIDTQGANSGIDNAILGFSVDVSSSNYNATHEATVLAQMIADGSLIIE
ncbi:hypothetical protein AB835_00840 [Candidatus Endobugula sertula]|uniref:Peptidase M10 serralysin C-terminal domain-containing protein n=1 Tax=Candidatus Endobugula sertula TaxID=62101 RepID=A0A1D2QTE5_9GAMM|nr:hypothetical protein AB835_00840 [Candidatus Endobugula sertula]